MNFFERLTARARSSSSTVSDAAEEHSLIANPTADGDPQVADATTESLKATDQTDVDAALERYLKRLEDQGIPAPGDWRNLKEACHRR
ncbi:hypothetical protein DND90_09410 [Pseudomonas syringae pv. maculicola]|nr:hypothetical protein DND90_09410 [Pseudomonas syringae pv. maculicola]